jgi:hypothetical protein
MNTQEVEELADWDEGDLTQRVAELVRINRRLPRLDELAEHRQDRDQR